MANTFETKCLKCIFAHSETRITLSYISQNNDPPIMVIDYPLICRAPRVVITRRKNEEGSLRTPFKGQEVEPTNTCFAATPKKRQR